MVNLQALIFMYVWKSWNIVCHIVHDPSTTTKKDKTGWTKTNKLVYNPTGLTLFYSCTCLYFIYIFTY